MTVGRASALLLIAGLGGEIIVHAKISEYTSQIVALLNNQARAADERAGVAQQTAGEANRLAGEANERAAKANERAEAAHERAAQLEVQAAQLQAQAAKLRQENLDREKELIEVRKQVNVREISDKSQNKFTRSIDGRRRQVVLILPDEQEPRSYGDLSVRPMFEKAGFNVKLENLNGTAKNAGIIVCENSDGAIKIYQALRKAGIEARRSGQLKEWPTFCSFPLGGPLAVRVFIGQRIAPRAPRKPRHGR